MRRAAVLVLVGAAFCGPATAHAGSWSPPERVAAGTAPAVAVGPGAEQVVAYARPGGTGAAVRTRRGAGPWSAEQPLTAAPALPLSIEVSPAGDALVRLGREGGRQRFALRPAGAGGFGPAELTPEGLADASLALLPSGALVAAGRRDDGRIAVARREPGQGFGAAAAVSAEGETVPGPWAVVPGLGGEAVVAWVGPVVAGPSCGPGETSPMYVVRGGSAPARTCAFSGNVRPEAMTLRDTSLGLAISAIAGGRSFKGVAGRGVGSDPTVDATPSAPVGSADGVLMFPWRASFAPGDVKADFLRPGGGSGAHILDGSANARSRTPVNGAFDDRQRPVLAWADDAGVKAGVLSNPGGGYPAFCPPELVHTGAASSVALAVDGARLLAFADESAGTVAVATYTSRDGCVQPDPPAPPPPTTTTAAAPEPAVTQQRLIVRLVRRAGVDRKGRTRLQIGCSRACAGKVSIRRARTRTVWGSARFRFAKAGRRVVVLRLTRAGRRAVSRRRSIATTADVRLAGSPVKRLPLTVVRR